MNLDVIQMLYDYNYWAHRRVWDYLIRLEDEAFYRNVDYSIGSIHSQLVHTMSAEWIWLSRLQGTSPTAVLQNEDYPTREAIRLKWDEIENDMRRFLNKLDDSRLNESFTFNSTKGIPHEESVLGVLIHVVNHGTDHRAQMLALCHQLGGETIEQDLTYYLREQ